MAIDPQSGSALWSRPTRRGVLAGLAGLLAAGVVSPALAVPLPLIGDGGDAEPGAGGSAALPPGARTIALRNLNTLERIDVAYWQGDRYDPEALARLDAFMRDSRSDEIGQMDPALYDMLWSIGLAIGEDPEFTVLCGYRSQSTSRTLAGTGVARDSMHLHGRAVDFSLEGAALSALRDTALALHAGGVGYYPRSNFVHVDTGEVRTW